MHKIITTLPLKTWNALAGAVRSPAQNDHETAQCLYLGANVAAVTDGHYAMVRVVQGAPARKDDLPLEATLSAIPYATVRAVAKTKQPAKAGAWMVRVGLGEADRPTIEILNELEEVQSTIWACAVMPMREDEYKGRDGLALLARFSEFADQIDKSGKR